MNIIQVLKAPLRLVGLGAEPKDSAPIPVSLDIQRTLSLICGKDRQSLIPFGVDRAGAMKVLPPSITTEDVVSNQFMVDTLVTLDKPCDMLEILIDNALGHIHYGITGLDFVGIPLSTSMTVADIDFMWWYSTTAWRIAGPILQFKFISFHEHFTSSCWYQAVRFKHGRE